MTESTVVDVRIGTVRVPGATLYYEVRGEGPLVALIGSPMDATAFASLADLLASEHTVLTADPRGSNRSRVDDREQNSTPELRAADLSQLIRPLSGDDASPVAVFGSSGGAVTALALAQAHPEQVHTVIAHEPPLDQLLDDRVERMAATEHIIRTYREQGRAAGWRAFLADASIDLPEEVFDMMFGADLAGDEAADEQFFFDHELRATTRWRPNVERLRSTPPFIVPAIGRDSAGQICDRTTRALATALGLEPVLFPGDHTGFLDDPVAFAEQLRALLPAR